MLVSRALVEGDPLAAADAADLHYATDGGPGWWRKKRGKGFSYVSSTGAPLRDRASLARIRALAIPPAWREVWVSSDANAHLQSTGRDARGRKQYRYHARWREVRDTAKYHRFVEFCAALPKLRAHVDADLSCPCLCKAKVVATIVSLMERAQLRVGNDEYARQNGSYGATTLRARHVSIHGETIELAYRGKSGVDRRVRVTDRRLANIVRKCRELPGQRLFQFVDGDTVHPITSSDVNEYIHAVTAGPFTAKDYRTWAATLGAAMLLCLEKHPGSATACKRSIKGVIARVAERLGHTPTVCRASYIHPRVLEDFSSQKIEALARSVRRKVKKAEIEVDALRAIEPAVARYLS